MNCPACGYYNPLGAQTCFHCSLSLPVPAAGDARCAAHPELQATGACSRCGTFGCGRCLTQKDEQWLCPNCLARELRLPWDDRVEIGAFRAWWRTSVRMMGSPEKTLAHAQRPDSPGGSVLFAFFSTLVGSAPSWLFCMGGSLLVTLVSKVDVPDAGKPEGLALGFGLLSVLGLFSVITTEAVSVFIEHGLLLTSGVRPRFAMTLRAHALSMSPYLVGAVPFCGALICPLWAVALRVAAFKALHGVTTGPAVLAAVVPLLLIIGLSVLPFLI